MKGYIYCIKSYQNPLIYYGSTIQQLSKRMAKHRNNYKNYLLGNNYYTSSFEILKNQDAYIELIEIINFEDKEELKKIENKYINENECVNKRNSFLNRKIYNKEYNEVNKEKIKETRKEYRKKNREILTEKMKLYRQIDSHCDLCNCDVKKYYMKQHNKKYHNIIY